MDISLDKRAIRQIRQSAADAIEDGDTETLREDLVDAFSEEQIEEIERRIDGGDFYDFLGDTLEEWDGDDVDELFELLETHLSDVGIELKYRATGMGSDDEDDDDDAGEDLEDEDDESSGDDDEDYGDDDIGSPLELEEPDTEL